ncbi:caspase family protein [Bradyrhizobium sp. AZCC 2289]|uniref:caspase family protein n=1 Tax=Bradyrhizobium sp. AZCC 2289 TaxID=3117026 RepID=UPI003FA565F2
MTAAQAVPLSDAPACRSEGKRFALLIGNQDYKGALTPLANPRRDTAAFSKLLCSNGFTLEAFFGNALRPLLQRCQTGLGNISEGFSVFGDESPSF